MGVLYQQLDHMLILLSASIGEPGRYPGLSCFEASITGTRFSNFPEKETRY